MLHELQLLQPFQYSNSLQNSVLYLAVSDSAAVSKALPGRQQYNHQGTSFCFSILWNQNPTLCVVWKQLKPEYYIYLQYDRIIKYFWYTQIKNTEDISIYSAQTGWEEIFIYCKNNEHG